DQPASKSPRSAERSALAPLGQAGPGAIGLWAGEVGMGGGELPGRPAIVPAHCWASCFSSATYSAMAEAGISRGPALAGRPQAAGADQLVDGAAAQGQDPHCFGHAV